MEKLEESIMSHFVELICIMAVSWISLVAYGLIIS
jgi:hypothetical protein